MVTLQAWRIYWTESPRSSNTQKQSNQ